ncbi:MAG: VanZ family protein [Rhodothermales bacterium]
MTWRFAAAVGWTLLIVALCTLPGQNLPGTSIVGADKFVHFGLFVGFAVLWLHVTRNGRTSAVRNVIVAGLLLAGGTEIYQGLIPFHRDPDLFDALANTAGLLSGVAGYLFWRPSRHPPSSGGHDPTSSAATERPPKPTRPD